MVSWYYLIVTTLLLLLIGLLVYLQRRRMIPPGELPRCGACGYVVKGLPGNICPECGGDLNVVGIVRPGQRRRPSRLAAAVQWTVLLMLLAPFVLGAGPDLLDDAIPSPLEWNWDVTLRQPGSGGYESVTIAASARGWNRSTLGQKPRINISLLLVDGTSRQLRTDDEGIIQDGAFSGQPISTEVIEAWMRAIGISGDDERVRKEAGVIAVAVATREHDTVRDSYLKQAQPGAQVFTGSGGSYGGPTRMLNEGHIRIGLGLLLCVVWLAGIILIIRRRPFLLLEVRHS